MSAYDPWSDGNASDDVSLDMSAVRYQVSVAVDDELLSAVEGWRRAHGLTGQPEALGELVRLGLMSEIAKIYRLVCDEQAEENARYDGLAERSGAGRPNGEGRDGADERRNLTRTS